MKKNITVIILLLIFSGTRALAEPGEEVASKPVSAAFYGQSKSQITLRFGKPEQVIEKRTGSEEWRYGESSVFFIGDKVSAWSDAGELARRERVKNVKRASLAVPPKRNDSLVGEWENPWTAPAR